MAKLKDGFYKQTAEAIGSDLHVLLAGGGSKALTDFAYKSDLTGFVTGGPYLPLSGGSMANAAVVTFTANGTLRQTTATTSNATSIIEWYKGTTKDANYTHPAQIGWHNTGNTDGAIYLVPYPTNTDPWASSVGLYIGKTALKWNNQGLIHSGNIVTQSVAYATSAGNADTVDNLHASDLFRAYGTLGTGNNYDSDWGQSIVTFDPVVNGTYPESNPNVTILNLGNNYARRKQLAFNYNNNNIYFRRRLDSSWQPWVRLALASEIPAVTNYYWADQLITGSAKVNATPTFGSVKSTGLITAQSGIQIGSTSDIGWYFYNSRICAGNSVARGVNTGSLLVSSAWADDSKVPTNGIYSKGNIITPANVQALNLNLHGDWETDFGIHFNEGGDTKYGFSLLYGDSDLFKLVTRNTGTASTVFSVGRGSTQVDFKGKVTVANRLYPNEWIQFNNNTGLYWPNHPNTGIEMHIRPNTYSSYGGFAMYGKRGGYSGILLGTSNTNLCFMDDGNNSGLYIESLGKWIIYSLRSGNQIGIGTSSCTTNYGITLGSSTHIKGNLLINGESYCYTLTTNSSSNWVYLTKLLTGSSASGKSYEAGIGWHNTGGDGTGALTLVPHAQNTSPWAGTVGLYITASTLAFNGTAVSLSGHTHDDRYYTETESDGRFYPLAGSVNMSGDNKWIGSTMGGGTDYWRIGGYGSSDNGICKITIGDNSNDKFQIEIADYSGTTYIPLEVINTGINITGNAIMTRGVVGGYNNTSYALSTASFICNSWIRTKGATGWYNEDYGGGWYMTDATWIRNYNSKPIYLSVSTYPSLVCNAQSGAESNIRFEVGGTIKGYVGYNAAQGAWVYNAACAKYLALSDSGLPHVSGKQLAMCHSTSFNTDAEADDTTASSITDFFTRLNYSGLFTNNFGMCRGSWWYVGNTQYNTGVGTLEMAGTAVLNMSAYADTSANYKSLLFLTAYGDLYSYASEESGVATWSRYSKEGHSHRVTKLHRSDASDDYYLRHYWTGSYWYLQGYYGSSYHAGVQVAYANSAGNADTVDGQHFNWSNNANDHTYLWAASSNGQAYLVHRASMSVNYATYSRYVYCTSGSYLNFQWSGQGGQPTWLFGSNDGANVYVWNPSNFSVNYANSAGSATKATQDGNGNTISSYYVTLGTDQTISGKKTFSNVILFSGNDSYGIRTATNNYVRIGESSYRFYQCYVSSYYATSGFYQDSDIRLKNIVQNVEVNLDDLAKLQKVYYTWKSGIDTNKHIGMIAQEVQKLYPELVNTDEETGYLSLSYDQLSVIALKAIDKLYAMIKDIQSENKHLKERLNQLENRIS